MRRPRLLVVASTYPAATEDGTPAFVRDIALEMAAEFDTMILVPRIPGAPRHERVHDVQIRRFAYFPRRWEDLAQGAILENLRARRSRWLQVAPFVLGEALALRRCLREHRPDVVHLHWMIPQGIAALLVARGRSWVVTTLGGDVYALQDPLSRWTKRAVLRRASAVTTMNEDMRRRLIALGAAPDSTHVMPMGVDLRRVQAAAGTVERDPTRLLFAGRLVEKKGAEILLEAVRGLAADVEWSLDIVGDGPLRAALERAAAGLPVRFHGQLHRAELYRLYHGAGVVVVPSVTAASGDQDGLPVVLLEAMGAGAAVVASDLPGINEAVTDRRTGLLVRPANAAALRTALVDVLGDPELRDRLGTAARTEAERFSLVSTGERYRAVLRAAGATGTDARGAA